MTEKAQYDAKKPVEVVDRPTSVDVFHLLSEPLPVEALSLDESRGFPLTSIKAGFVLERLQEVFGLLGYGWRYAVGPHWREVGDKGEEILVEVAIQWRVTDDVDQARYSPPAYWLKQWDPQTAALMEGWEFGPGPAVWSEPVFAKGGSSARRKGSTPLTDAHRSAVTNALTKGAGRMGIGQEVYKDQDELSLAMNDAGQGKNRRQGSSRQDTGRRSSEARRPGRATGGTCPGFAGLEAIQEAARDQVARLTFDDVSDSPVAKTVQQLAQYMESIGLKMQPARLVHVLLGEGAFTQKGVMATHNLLLKGRLSGAKIELLNQVAFQ